MGYSSVSIELVDIFKNLNEKKLLLPNFQREFVWGKSDQKALLASFFVGLPIGSFLFLEGPKDEYPSKELGKKKGIIDYEEIKPRYVEFLLDGQQRITTLKSIFTDIFENNENINDFKTEHTNTFGKIRRRWFIKIEDEDAEEFFNFEDLKFDEYKYKYTEPQDIEEMFTYEKVNRTKSKDKWYNPLYKLENNLSKEEYRERVIGNAVKEKRIPLFFLTETYSEKIYQTEINYRDTVIYKILQKIAINKHGTDPEVYPKVIDWTKDVYDYLKGRFAQDLHIIKVPSEEKGRAIPIFENINSGGTALDTFDLIVAKAADKSTDGHRIYNDEKESLRNAIRSKLKNEIKKANYEAFKTNDMMSLPENWTPTLVYFDTSKDMYKKFKDQYLNLLSVVSYLEDYANVENIKGDFFKKDKILDLKAQQINNNTFEVLEALINTGMFLQFRCGITSINDLSYKLMLLPIAYVMLDHGVSIYKEEEKLNLLEIWYWYSLFSGTYRDNKNKRCLEDIELLYEVIINDNTQKLEDFMEEYRGRFLNFTDYSDKNTLINNDDVPNAIKNTIRQYLLSRCPNDLLENNKRISAWKISKNDIDVEFHHIIPLGSDLINKVKESETKLRDKKDHILNSPLNLTPILKGTNKSISSMAINNYLDKVSGLSKERHCLPNERIADEYVANEIFYKEFLAERFKQIKRKIRVEFENLSSNTNININF
ncbi:DUF262 domain-containing protein [Selenihalanaerobacter shriftii]|uniref:GmrSD restriction endonucleases N-terminal domain-containing protein n=1 Tax=Selenihalanaerobacter shriftii TaxID=142842 RepID=A0A1T4NES7_9FIRM|nr:DUF262 domain-containing protein [Selenihalanaerobacter shriftii]SJZ77613.1 hypothetical protein SAMN02745118_01783 [Selenihalanaerobacter shriftii]